MGGGESPSTFFFKNQTTKHRRSHQKENNKKYNKQTSMMAFSNEDSELNDLFIKNHKQELI